MVGNGNMSSAIQDFDFSVNILRALLWRHNEALNLQSILQSKQNWHDINQQQFWDDWVRDVFDLRTANEFGMSVWALILNVPLSLIAPKHTGPVFGFGTYNQNFSRGTFGASQAGVGLTLDQKRLLLQLRYFKLISRCTVPATNALLKSLLGSYGSIYILDANDMSYVTYIFGFEPNSSLKFILQNFDVLPRPAAVGVRYVVSTRPAFGFGTFNKNFNQGTFRGDA